MVSVREALEVGGFEPNPDLLAPDAVWIGRFPGELCRNRDEVLEMLREGVVPEVRAYVSRDSAIAAVEGRPW